MAAFAVDGLTRFREGAPRCHRSAAPNLKFEISNLKSEEQSSGLFSLQREKSPLKSSHRPGSNPIYSDAFSRHNSFSWSDQGPAALWISCEKSWNNFEQLYVYRPGSVPASLAPRL